MKTIYVITFHTDKLGRKTIALDNRELAFDFISNLEDRSQINNVLMLAICDLLTSDEVKIIDKYL